MERTVPVDLSFVLAKIHGMRSWMYERERLERLLGSRNILELMRTVRSGGEADEFASHRQFEQALVGVHIAELDRLARYLESSHRQVLNAFLRRYQVENLKVILRGWVRQATVKQVTPYLVELPEGLALPIARLLSSRGLGAFTKNIPSKELAQGAALGREQLARTASAFFIEAGLDRAWMSGLLEAADQLGRSHREPVLELVGLEADQRQALFVLRARINYDLAVEDIRPFLIDGPGMQISVSEVMKSASVEDARQMFTQLPKINRLTGRPDWPDESIIGGVEPHETIETLQKLFSEKLYALANRLYYSCVFNLGAALAFCYLKRTELANLIVLTESLRYDIPRAEVAERMMGNK